MIRIVKMAFIEGKEKDFLEIFNANKQKIASFPGCQSLKLLNDLNSPNIFFTYSHWDHEASLENYRKSELFAAVWKETKQLFAAKAEAWSVEALFNSQN